jgi:hypothetical protein
MLALGSPRVFSLSCGMLAASGRMHIERLTLTAFAGGIDLVGGMILAKLDLETILEEIIVWVSPG